MWEIAEIAFELPIMHTQVFHLSKILHSFKTAQWRTQMSKHVHSLRKYMQIMVNSIWFETMILLKAKPNIAKLIGRCIFHLLDFINMYTSHRKLVKIFWTESCMFPKTSDNAMIKYQSLNCMDEFYQTDSPKNWSYTYLC